MSQAPTQFINPPGLNDPSRYYTHVVTTAADVELIYISGQYGADENGDLVSTDYAEQVKQSFANLRTALAGVSARPADIVKITVLIVDHNEDKLGPLGEESDAMWGSRKPASTLIPVPRLALDGMLFEIDAVAVVS